MKWENVMPRAVRGEAPRVVLTGREEVLVEGHSGLFSYETGCVRIRVKDGLLAVTGEQLIIAFFGAEDLLIRGRVDGVTMAGEGL